jgi:hypothetical protein
MLAIRTRMLDTHEFGVSKGLDELLSAVNESLGLTSDLAPDDVSELDELPPEQL